MLALEKARFESREDFCEGELRSCWLRCPFLSVLTGRGDADEWVELGSGGGRCSASREEGGDEEASLAVRFLSSSTTVG